MKMNVTLHDGNDIDTVSVECDTVDNIGDLVQFFDENRNPVLTVCKSRFIMARKAEQEVTVLPLEPGVTMNR